MNADLHCHSTFSDGLLTPTQLVARAYECGVQMLALTDHDELAGLTEARCAAEGVGMRFIDGVEISVSWGEGSIHIVGLRINPLNLELSEGLERTRTSRDSRAIKMAASLAAAGIPDALEGALRYAGNPALISRAHFARFLVEQGYAREVRSVFEHYLVKGKPGFVPHQWASLAEAIGWVLASGGMAVIAHPGSYRMSLPVMRELLGTFRDLGGQGLEVLSGAHSPEQYQEYAKLAREYGLHASRGADYHGPKESRMEFGALPELPPDLTPVWQDW